MADVKAVRERLASNLLSALGANLVWIGDTVPATPVLPAVIIAPAPGTVLTLTTLEGAGVLNLVAMVLVSNVVTANAQNALDTYLSTGASNIRSALESGSSTDWDYVATEPISSYGQYTFGTGDAAQTFLGFTIPLTVAVS